MAASQPPSPEKETALAQQPTAADQRGTEQSPAVIKILPAQKTAEEAEADRKERAEKAESDWWLIKLTGILGLVGFLQLIVFGIQARRLRQTVQVATQQSKDMERSITESARAATAMETVAKHIEISSKAATESVATVKDATARQMRAYLSVEPGSWLRQRRTIRFEFRPFVVNNGNTPANNVSVLSRIGLIELPIPDDFDYSIDPNASAGPRSVASLGAHQNKFHSSVLPRRLTFSELRALHTGRLVFHVYGVVSYEDIFKEKRTTRFSYFIFASAERSSIPIWHLTEHNNEAD